MTIILTQLVGHCTAQWANECAYWETGLQHKVLLCPRSVLLHSESPCSHTIFFIPVYFVGKNKNTVINTFLKIQPLQITKCFYHLYIVTFSNHSKWFANCALHAAGDCQMLQGKRETKKRISYILFNLLQEKYCSQIVMFWLILENNNSFLYVISWLRYI